MFIYGLSIHHEDIDYLMHHLNILSNLYKDEGTYVFRSLYENPHAMDWIEKQLKNHPNEVDWTHLSRNPGAIPILKRQLFKVDWNYLAQNRHPDAFALLEVGINNCIYRWFRPLDSVFWVYLCANPNPKAMSILEKHLDKLSDYGWEILSQNPSAVPLLEKHLDKVNWFHLSANPSAIHLLKKHMHKVKWNALSRNPSALSILEKHSDKINWSNLCKNVNPSAMDLLENNVYDMWVILKIRWGPLCANPSALKLLEKPFAQKQIVEFGLFNMLAENPNPEVIHLLRPHLNSLFCGWGYLGENPCIAQMLGTMDYTKMRANCRAFARELTEVVFHPDRLLRLCDQHNMDLVDYMELIGD
jgi:hypothetical protein